MNPPETLDELHEMLRSAEWFSRSGQFEEDANTVAIRSLDEIENGEWLPTSKSEPDPIHQGSHADYAEYIGLTEECQRASTEAEEVTILSLNPVSGGISSLTEDFLKRAKGSAVYAARMAAQETVIDRRGFWCSLIPLYHKGFWPCGVRGGKVLIY